MKKFQYQDLNIVYEDNHLLVVVKPRNLGVCPDETQDDNLLDLLKQYLVETHQKPGEAYLGLVHRLDRPTGGVMLFAKTSKAASRLQESMRNKSFEKRYLAVVCGTLREKKGTMKNALLKDEKTNTVTCVPAATEGAKQASLDYAVLGQEGGLTLVEVKLETGRTHQIRVQFSSRGAPIYGDRKYGQGKVPAADSLALWAYELRVPHPVGDKTMVFRVLPPTEEIPWSLFEKQIALKGMIK